MTTDTPSLADRFERALDEVRATTAARGAAKGPAGALLVAILRLLEGIVALLAQLQAGTLAAVAPNRRLVSGAPAECAGSGAANAGSGVAGLARRCGP